jgi:hypothetical protein
MVGRDRDRDSIVVDGPIRRAAPNSRGFAVCGR